MKIIRKITPISIGIIQLFGINLAESVDVQKTYLTTNKFKQIMLLTDLLTDLFIYHICQNILVILY